jgi:uncharacterized protein GlcG (DUF336 family)
MLEMDEVQMMMRVAVGKAAELDAGIAVAIVDEGGYVQGVLRTDKANRISSAIAISKAYTSAILRRPTVEIVEDGPEVLAARRGLGLYPMTGSGGGIPIWRDGVVIGGIGVGGALPDPDIACAEAALAALADRAS